MKVEHTTSGAVLDVDEKVGRGLVSAGHYTAVEEEKPKRRASARRRKSESEDSATASE